MIVFGLVTPVGIFVSLGFANDIAGTGVAMLIAVAAGTFVYVALLEIVQVEVAADVHTIWKLVVMGAGWGMMSVLALWV